VTKLLVFVVENHSMDQMQQEMPWLDGVALRYGYTTDYRALAHPSLPNYLAMAGGDMFGVTDDDPPSAHPIDAPSVFGQALDAGRSATVYAESMTDPCQQADDGRYAVRHNPWTYFPAEQRQCRKHDLPLPALDRDVESGSLPNVGLVVPNTCSDAHDCPLSRADDWMRQYVGLVLAGPDFASGHLAVVVTADEDDAEHDNLIQTVVAHPSLEHVVVGTELTHYSLSRAFAEAAGIGPLAHAADAPSLLSAFGLR
jgi:acid phosphatase